MSAAWRFWPVACTALTDCDHAMEHETEATANQYAKAHMAEMVDQGGHAVCVCHADARPDLMPFDCGVDAYLGATP